MPKGDNSMYNATQKKEYIKILIAFAIFLIMSKLNIDLNEGFLYKYIDNQYQIYLSRVVHAIAFADIIFIVHSIFKFIFNRIILKTHSDIKTNIESKIKDCEKVTFSNDVNLNVAEIIKKIINAYNTDNVKEYSKEFCKELERIFSNGDDHSKRIISYFILANDTYESISNHIKESNSFHKDCLNSHENFILEFKNFKFENQSTNIDETKYNDILIHLLHATLEKDPVDIEVVNFLRSFYSWFCGNLYKNYNCLKSEKFMILLQFIPLIVGKINYHFKQKNNKNMISSTSPNLIIVKILIIIFANIATFKLCNIFNGKIITKEKIETYARYAGLVTRYYDYVFILSKLILFLTLVLRNHIFNNLYHQITGYYAVSLLLAAEAIVSNVNSDDKLGDKVANLIISVAGLAV